MGLLWEKTLEISDTIKQAKVIKLHDFKIRYEGQGEDLNKDGIEHEYICCDTNLFINGCFKILNSHKCRIWFKSSYSLNKTVILLKVNWYTTKNTVISPNFLMWKFCEKTQFLHSFAWITRTMWNVSFHKFPHQIIRWNYGILRSDTLYDLVKICLIIDKWCEYFYHICLFNLKRLKMFSIILPDITKVPGKRIKS